MTRGTIHSLRRSLPVIFALYAAITWLERVPAQSPAEQDKSSELLDQVRRQEQVAAQKVEAEVRDALRDVERLTVAHPDKAVERLQKIQAFLENDATLPSAKRNALKRMLK